jgi:hypothetical protein
MKVETIMNGTIRLVLIPENELEKIALEMISKTEIESTLINSQTAILNKVLQEGLVIQPKGRKED